MYKLPQLVLVLSCQAYSALDRILLLKDTFVIWIPLQSCSCFNSLLLRIFQRQLQNNITVVSAGVSKVPESIGQVQ